MEKAIGVVSVAVIALVVVLVVVIVLNMLYIIPTPLSNTIVAASVVVGAPLGLLRKRLDKKLNENARRNFEDKQG